MPDEYTVIPANAVVIPVALIALGAMLLLLHRRRALTLGRTALAVVTCVYGSAVLQSTLLPFPIRVGTSRDGMAPWHAYLQLVPFYDHDPTGYILNVALFVPLGVLLPLVWRVSSVRRAVVIGFLASFVVELVQFILVISVTSGRVADVDDLIANTLGTLVGFIAFRIAQMVPPLGRLMAAVIWPAKLQQT